MKRHVGKYHFLASRKSSISDTKFCSRSSKHSENLDTQTGKADRKALSSERIKRFITDNDATRTHACGDDAERDIIGFAKYRMASKLAEFDNAFNIRKSS